MNAIRLNHDAIKFFKKNGLEKSKDVIKMSAHALVDCGDGSYFHINQLKQIVDAFELVESWGGLEDAKLYDLSHCESKPESMGYKLMKAIQLVEQCNA